MTTFTRWMMTAVAAVAFLACAGTAAADEFTINFAGGGFTGTLNVDAVLTSPGVYSIDAISGTVSGFPVTGLVATTTSTGYSDYTLPDGSFWFYDNLLFPDVSPVVDTGGILFTLAGLAQPVNLFSTPQGQFGIYLGGGNFPNDFLYTPVDVTVATPEPSTLALGLVGLALLAGIAMKKKLGMPALNRQMA